MVATLPEKSFKVLEFFGQISGPWKPRKLPLSVLESPERFFFKSCLQHVCLWTVWHYINAVLLFLLIIEWIQQFACHAVCMYDTFLFACTFICTSFYALGFLILGRIQAGFHSLPEDGQKWGGKQFFINYLPSEDKTTKKIQKIKIWLPS